MQEHDAPFPLGLLRARSERPRGDRAAEQREEIAPSHSDHGGFLPVVGLPHPQPATGAAIESYGGT
jgi:hypothetical protein